MHIAARLDANYRGEGNFLGIVRFFNAAVESVRNGGRVR